MRIAIIGATGLLGYHCAQAALTRGHELLVIHRRASKLDALRNLRHATAVADLDDRDALTRALAGAEAVINCAGHYPTVPRPWRTDVAIGAGQMANFYAACGAHRLHKIVYLGGSIALRKHPRGESGDETLGYPGEPRSQNAYLQVKWAMDRQALEAARGGLPVVIGIPTMTFGDHDPGGTTGRLLIEIANRTLPAYVRGRRNVIYAGDAGRGLVRVCEDGRPGERYLLTGANLTMDELVARIATLAGVAPPRAVPLAAARVTAAVQKLRYRWFRGPLPKVDDTAIAVMSAGQFLRGDKAERELGFKAEVGIDEALRRAFDWFRARGDIKAREED